MITAEKIEEELNSSINQFREGDTSDSIIADYDLSSPCQLELFWMHDPIDLQLLILTHDENRPDKQILVNGPYQGTNFFDEIDNVLEKPRWQQPIDEKGYSPSIFDLGTGTNIEVSRRRDTLLGVIQEINQWVIRQIFINDEERVAQSTLLTDKIWCLYIMGNVTNMSIGSHFQNPFQLLNGNDSEPESDDEEPESDDEEPESDDEEPESDDEEPESDDEGVEQNPAADFEKEPDGHGTYFYEPVWIGETPDRDFKQRVLGEAPGDLEIVLSTEFGGHQISIRRDGLIVVHDTDPETVLSVLNVVFGASIITDHSFLAATLNDLVEISIYEDDEMRTLGTPDLPRQIATLNSRDLAFSSRSMYDTPHTTRDVVSLETIKELLETAETIYSDEGLRERVNFTLQAYTHHVNGEYAQAFLLSWISIERFINSLLDKHLKGIVGVNHGRRDKMIDSPNWTSTHKIELLEISGAISDERYRIIDRLRKKRNKIVHEMENADKSESKEIISLTYTLIRNEIEADGEELYEIDI